jgi:hypothetical protein
VPPKPIACSIENTVAFGVDLLVRAILQYFGFLADLSQWANQSCGVCPLITLDRFWQASKLEIIWNYGYASGGLGGVQVGQTAKARSGYRVQSLHMGRDRQYKPILIKYPLPRLVKTARPMGRSDGWPREEPDDEDDAPKDDDDHNEEDDENDEDDGYSE